MTFSSSILVLKKLKQCSNSPKILWYLFDYYWYANNITRGNVLIEFKLPTYSVVYCSKHRTNLFNLYDIDSTRILTVSRKLNWIMISIHLLTVKNLFILIITSWQGRFVHQVWVGHFHPLYIIIALVNNSKFSMKQNFQSVSYLNYIINLFF